MRRSILWRASVLAGVLGLAGSALASDAERLRELDRLLVQDCGSCHGLSGRGGLGPPLLPAVLQTRPREVLVNAILFGRPGTAMPPWRALLDPAEAEWLVDRMLTGGMQP